MSEKYTMKKAEIFEEKTEEQFLKVANSLAKDLEKASGQKIPEYTSAAEYYDKCFTNAPQVIENLFNKQTEQLTETADALKAISTQAELFSAIPPQIRLNIMSSIVSALNLNNVSIMHINDTLRAILLQIGRNNAAADEVTDVH